MYLVQAFVAAGLTLRAEPTVVCRSAEAARLKAEKLAGVKAGVVAYSFSADPDTAEYDETPTIIFKAGRMSAAFDDN